MCHQIGLAQMSLQARHRIEPKLCSVCYATQMSEIGIRQQSQNKMEQDGMGGEDAGRRLQSDSTNFPKVVKCPT